MNWMRTILNPIRKTTRVGSKMFVFEEVGESAVYADFMTSLAQSPNLKLLREIENWDQTGILTIIVNYEIRD